jgi:hypothetical protein
MKEIKNFSGYFVTEDGRVFSAWKQQYIKGLQGSARYLNFNNITEVKYSICKGYLQVHLQNEKKKMKKTVHRLVAETYLKNPNNLSQVNHIDENKLNNHINNIEWVTQNQNIIYSQCRWIWEIENIITGEIAETINLRQFAKDNSLHPSHLHQTLNGRLKKHKNFRIISKTQFK